MNKRTERVRTIRFECYSKGNGPRFTLSLYDVDGPGTDEAGRYHVGYTLAQGREVIFDSDTNGTCRVHAAIDSDAAAECVMSFLTLRPGDTDPDYFDSYTPEQFSFCEQHAETLGHEAMARFCCDECGVVTDNRRTASGKHCDRHEGA